jgi:DNA invertase Pin-like site-specific DNA recombinase
MSTDAPRPVWWNGVVDALDYRRFSKPDQSKGYSATRQQDRAEAYAERYGLKIIDTYADKGVSSFTGENSDIGTLSRLLTAARNNKFRRGTHLLMELLDRLTRQQIRRAHRLFDDLIEAGLVIHTLIGEQVFWDKQIDEDPTKLIIAIVILMRGNNESATKSNRSQKNIERARKLARTDMVPLNRAPAWIDIVHQGNKRVFRLNRYAKTVRRIFEEASAGLTIHEICRRLNADKIETLGNSTH